MDGLTEKAFKRADEKTFGQLYTEYIRSIAGFICRLQHQKSTDTEAGEIQKLVDKSKSDKGHKLKLFFLQN